MLLSIITPSLNRQATVGAAIESVLKQGSTVDFEHIIVDGGSTDGTLELLASYPHLRVISGPDRNLYEAINKGIGLSRGDVIGHLNSDDVYLPDVLGGVMDAFSQAPDVDTLCGGAEMVQLTGVGERVVARINNPDTKRLREQDVIRGVPIINARFFRRRLYDRMGGYDTRFAIAADRDFLFRLLLSHTRREILPTAVYRYRVHAGSLTLGTAQARERYLRDNLNVALTRLSEAVPRSPAHAAYRRWHAWAAGYLTVHLVLKRRPWESAVNAGRGIRWNPIWPIQFAGAAIDQLRERGLRNGL